MTIAVCSWDKIKARQSWLEAPAFPSGRDWGPGMPTPPKGVQASPEDSTLAAFSGEPIIKFKRLFLGDNILLLGEKNLMNPSLKSLLAGKVAVSARKPSVGYRSALENLVGLEFFDGCW